MMMDEARWLRCRDARQMLPCLRRRKPPPTERKLRLYAVACCRRLWSVMEEPCRRSIEVAERFADGQASADEMATAHAAILTRNRGVGGMHRRSPLAHEIPTFNAWSAAEGATRIGNVNIAKTIGEAGLVAILRADLRTDGPDQAILFREVFGNPFAPLDSTVCPRTANILTLAASIYEDRNPAEGELDATRLAVLADMIEEAGCTCVELLRHLRSEDAHVRGCWVLDLLLGKE
jgi:hypothetical protein